MLLRTFTFVFKVIKHSNSASCPSAGQETHRLPQNPKVHYRVHNCKPLDNVLSQINPAHTPPLQFSNITYQRIPTDLFSSGFSIKILCALLISSKLATCSAHLILPDLITLMTSGEKCK
jgi:hypothetical protein